MFCRYFILRPVLSIVISIVIVIAGLVSMYASPIEQYPNIVPPCLNISVNFPGADSETIANAVAAPIEDQMSGVPGMIYMQSASANGSSSVSLNVYFQVGTDLKSVEADALNRINTALPQLPTQVQAQGVTMRMKNPDLFLVIPFYSEDGNPDLLYISNYVQRYIYPVLLQIPGIGVISILGQRQFAMRAWLDPNKMAYYGIGVADIKNALNDQNWPWAIGMNAMEPMVGLDQKYNYMINSPGYMTDESQFQNVVLKATESSAQVVRLKDVARVTLDAQSYATYFEPFSRNLKTGKMEKHNAVGIAIYLVPGANQIQVKNSVSSTLDAISKHLPAGIKYYYHYDSSQFVLLSIQAVIQTLLIAFVLVFMVVMLFMQNFKGTIIPVLAIPVAIIGTFAGTYALGFSINTLTLFGMVLAIGIVVDDAIVVLENVERLMKDEGLNSVDAAIKCMVEVASPVIAVVAVLNAVFVPVAFLGGFSGVLMKQFAVTIAVSTLLSGVVALTLTPTLCAIMLKNSKHGDEKPTPQFKPMILLQKFFDKFNIYFEKLLNRYMDLVTYIIDNSKIALLIWAGVVVAVIVSFMHIPTALVPLEDMGYYYNTQHVNNAGSMAYNLQQAESVSREVLKLPAVNRVAILGGLDVVDNGATKTNSSTLSIILDDYDSRPPKDSGVDDMIAATNKIVGHNKNITGFAFNQPPIRGMSTTGGVTFYLQANLPLTVEQIYDDSVKLTQYMQKNYPEVAMAAQFYNISTPEMDVKIDPAKVYLYKLTYAQVFNTLQAVFGTYYINYFTKWEDLWWVILQGDYKFRNTPEMLNTMYIKNNVGDMIPAGSVASLQYRNSAEVVTRLNDFLASQIVVNPSKGHTSGEIMDIIREAVPKVLGKDYTITWFGPSYQQAIAGNTATIAFTLGIIMVFLILAALYELWALPLAIMMALPFALLGAAITLLIFNKPNDIYFQVSMLTLIGLSAKNAILITEFAIDAVRLHGMTYREAALHAARIRFRPIIMTSIAFILGAVPLVTATGAGANSQHSVGLGIIGGMIGSTCIATLFVPLFFITVMSFSKHQEPVGGNNHEHH
jgi:hydrophobe/amphiphile efflux-1 (HAE1) family protein